jgi:hypothetical protein
VVEPTVDPCVALIMLMPTPAPVANPPVVIVATEIVADPHVTEPVKFCVLLSLYVPVAVNCNVKPLAIDGFTGVTVIDCSVALPTIRTVEPTTDPNVALIVLVPTPMPVASPPGLIVATESVAEPQVTELVRFCMLPSVYVPVAANCCVKPFAIDGFVGVTAIDCSVGAVTVNVVLPTTNPSVALIELMPTPAPVASPAAVIVATEVVAEAHVTEPVKFCVLLSLYVPVATNCCGRPLAIDGFTGVTVIDSSVALPTVITVDPTTDPIVALMVLVPVDTAVARPPAAIVATEVFVEAQVTVPVKFWVLLSV